MSPFLRFWLSPEIVIVQGILAMFFCAMASLANQRTAHHQSLNQREQILSHAASLALLNLAKLMNFSLAACVSVHALVRLSS